MAITDQGLLDLSSLYIPSLVGNDILAGENPAMAQTFLNQFLKAEGIYPTMDFRTPG